jgi:hypothetical protein
LRFGLRLRLRFGLRLRLRLRLGLRLGFRLGLGFRFGFREGLGFWGRFDRPRLEFVFWTGRFARFRWGCLRTSGENDADRQDADYDQRCRKPTPPTH